MSPFQLTMPPTSLIKSSLPGTPIFASQWGRFTEGLASVSRQQRLIFAIQDAERDFYSLLA